MASIGETQLEVSDSKSPKHSIQLLQSNATNTGLPHGLGLLTTVASLPPKYRSRYLSITTKSETPLDLSVKPISPQIANDVPIAASFAEVYTEPSTDPETQASANEEYTTLERKSKEPAVKEPSTLLPSAQVISIYETSKPSMTTFDIHKSPITPPPTPTKRKLSEQNSNHEGDSLGIEPEFTVEQFIADNYTNPVKIAKINEHKTRTRNTTPAKPIKSTDTAPKTAKSQPPMTKPTKNKATRKLKFDEETSSPVSGTIIRPLEDITDGSVQYSNGDIDPKYNIVEITEETKAELAAIKNVIGDYICKLCRLKFDDAFGLAQHRCACIVLLEYRCPECGKQFNCPANLASHRRWHKPKKDAIGNSVAGAKKENRNTTGSVMRQAFTNETQKQRFNEISTASATYSCKECGKAFKRQAYLRKHQLTHAIGGNNKSHSEDGESKTLSITRAVETEATQTLKTTTNSVAYPTYRGASSFPSGASLSSSSSSLHSAYSGTSMVHEDDVGVTYMVNGNSNSTNVAYEYDIDSMSDCSNSSMGCGRLQIVESGLTEEENIAAAALTNLRNCASVIQHTTLAH